MQRTLTYLIVACMLTVGVQIGRSQPITIDSNDVKSMFAVGKTIIYQNDSLTTTANIGAPGQTSFPFGSLVTSATEKKKNLSVASTPYAAQFPQATHAYVDSALSYSFYYDAFATTITLKGVGFYYYNLHGSLMNLGRQGAGNGYLYGVPIPAQGQWTFAPPSVEYSLPLELSKTWIDTYTESISGTYTLGSPTPFGPIVTTHTVRYFVDAYGTLTLPGSITQEALRIRKMDIYSGSSNGFRAGYIFLAKNGASVQLAVIDTSATSGTVAVTSVQWTNPAPTSVRTVVDVPKTFGLDQNYPNPFNPVTNIGFRVSGPGSSSVKLGVYDMLGREVALLVDERKPAGEYRVEFNGSGLASGIYHYRLTAAGDGGLSVETKSMMLVK